MVTPAVATGDKVVRNTDLSRDFTDLDSGSYRICLMISGGEISAEFAIDWDITLVWMRRIINKIIRRFCYLLRSFLSRLKKIRVSCTMYLFRKADYIIRDRKIVRKG